MPANRTWNWQQPDWPNFQYDSDRLAPLEAQFLRQSGLFLGAVRHVETTDRQQLEVELISDEALYSSEIEGELLNRESLQSSIRRNFGLATDHRQIPRAEQGIAEMMVAVYREFAAPLDGALLCRWHRMLLNGRRDLKNIGSYRTDPSPMQIVSGPVHEPKIHFEAPPARAVPREMARFLRWLTATAPMGRTPLAILTRAGLAHLHFVSIHPFDDGNGRIGRALAEKVLSEGLQHPTLTALSSVINQHRKTYYDTLERNNKRNEITPWLVYFAETVLEAQRQAQRTLDFLIAKSKLSDRLRGQLNPRQEKALLRMMREGHTGFRGGLSAENYIRITGASRATTTRDLHDLVEKQALVRSGERKGTRYQLSIAPPPPGPETDPPGGRE